MPLVLAWVALPDGRLRTLEADGLHTRSEASPSEEGPAVPLDRCAAPAAAVLSSDGSGVLAQCGADVGWFDAETGARRARVPSTTLADAGACDVIAYVPSVGLLDGRGAVRPVEVPGRVGPPVCELRSSLAVSLVVAVPRLWFATENGLVALDANTGALEAVEAPAERLGPSYRGVVAFGAGLLRRFGGPKVVEGPLAEAPDAVAGGPDGEWVVLEGGRLGVYGKKAELWQADGVSGVSPSPGWLWVRQGDAFVARSWQTGDTLSRP